MKAKLFYLALLLLIMNITAIDYEYQGQDCRGPESVD